MQMTNEAQKTFSLSSTQIKGEDDNYICADFMAKHVFGLDIDRQVLEKANISPSLVIGYDRGTKILQVVDNRLQKISPNSEEIVCVSNKELELSKTWFTEPNKQ